MKNWTFSCHLARNEKTQEENEKRQKYEHHVEIVSTFHQGRKQTKKNLYINKEKKCTKKSKNIAKNPKHVSYKKVCPSHPWKARKKKNLKIIRHKNRNNEEKTEKINNGRILLQIEIFFGKQKQRKTNHNSMEFKKKNFLMKKKIRKKGEEKNSKMNEATVSIWPLKVS